MKKSIKIEMSIKMHEGIYCQIKLVKKTCCKITYEEIYLSVLIKESMKFFNKSVNWIYQEFCIFY